MDDNQKQFAGGLQYARLEAPRGQIRANVF
jgi:hypothetical protein